MEETRDRPTIEAVLQLRARLERDAIDLLTRKNAVQSQTEEVIAQSTGDGLPVEQSTETSPSNLLLQLIKIEARRVQE